MCSKFLYIGHRGTRTDFDENTIQAFKKAIEFGANYIELDVRKTKDNKLIVLHDPTLDRTTNGSGDLHNFSLSELRLLKTKLRKKKIPLLSEVLEIFRSKVGFMIDLKQRDIEDETFNFINSIGLLNECIFSGRSLEELQKLKSNDPQLKVCYNITKGDPLSKDDFLELGRQKKLSLDIDLISLRSDLITSEFINICHFNNILVLSWDFLSYKNPLEKIKNLINCQINGILFDNYKNIQLIKKQYKKA
ncbi:MAG: glycerophosphodiester phosphodiesterase [Candidatus Hermodarchaeota archaeon]